MCVRQGSGTTQQALHRADKQVVGPSDPSEAFGAQAVPEDVDEGGVELAAGSVVWREGLALFGQSQLLAPLGVQEVQAPRLFGSRGGARATVLARLSDGGILSVEILRFLFWRDHGLPARPDVPGRRSRSTCSTRRRPQRRGGPSARRRRAP